jgi:N,N'-diacetyllegionaminate synthase
MVQKLELSKEDHEVLIEHCEANNIGFLSTAFDSESVDLLESFGQRIFKIPSGEITNFPLIRQIARIPGKKIISTGMSTMEEIKQAIEVLEKAGTTRSDMIVLHCNTQYPTPMEDVNLRAMNTIKEECNVAIGYSDHTLGIEVPIAAVAMGAQLIEKHFTLDRRMVGPDHAASLEPKELKAMVQSIRNIEQALGDGVKRVSPSEKENIKIARKSVFYNQSLTSGDVITIEHLVMKRPGDGISPSKIDEIVGKIVTSDVHKEAYFKWSDVS